MKAIWIIIFIVFYSFSVFTPYYADPKNYKG